MNIIQLNAPSASDTQRKTVPGWRHLSATESRERAIQQFYRDPEFQRMVLEVIREAQTRGSGIGRAIETIIFSQSYLDRKLGIADRVVIRTA